MKLLRGRIKNKPKGTVNAICWTIRYSRFTSRTHRIAWNFLKGKSFLGRMQFRSCTGKPMFAERVKPGKKVRSGAASHSPRAVAPAVPRPRRHAKAIIGAIGSALYCARERPRDANKFGGGRGRTALPLVIIRLSRNCFYVLNGKVRYLLRTCRKSSFYIFLRIPISRLWKLCDFDVNEAVRLYIYISFSVRLFAFIFIICKRSQKRDE